MLALTVDCPVDQLRPLAADPDRQAPQRPLHPAAPKPLLDDWITHHRPNGLRVTAP